MRLLNFRIKNIKSIIDTGVVSFGASNILVIAGQNEAGKTAVIDGLNYFNNGPSQNHKKLLCRPDGNTYVECNYELTDADIEYLITKTPDKEDLHTYLQKNRGVGLVRGGDEEDAEQNDKLRASTTTQQNLGAFFLKEPDTTGEKRTWPGWTAFHEELLSDVLRTHTSYDDTFNNLLPGEIKASEVSDNEAVQDFQKVFDVDFIKSVENEGRAVTALETKVTKNATDDLNKYWTQRLDVGSQYSFRVKINRNPTEPLSSVIEFTVENQEDDPTPLYLEQKSKGFRWFSAFNLRLRALGVNADHPEDLLLLIDEPGEGLHEKAQLDLKVVIEELAEKGARIIYTTHNPLLIGTQGDELSRIRIAANLPKQGTKVYTLAQYSSTPGLSAQEALSPLVTAMGLNGIDQLKPNNLQNVVVEGITDMYYYLGFSKLLKYKGSYYISAMGADNVPNIIAILLGWGQPYKAILDDDKKGRAVYKKLRDNLFMSDDKLMSNHVYRPAKTSGVEDIFSTADFQKFVTKDSSKKRTSLSNSEAAKGAKEILARSFYDAVHNGEIKIADLDAETKANITSAVDWVKS